jgi:hypothetical protein
MERLNAIIRPICNKYRFEIQLKVNLEKTFSDEFFRTFSGTPPSSLPPLHSRLLTNYNG